MALSIVYNQGRLEYLSNICEIDFINHNRICVTGNDRFMIKTQIVMDIEKDCYVIFAADCYEGIDGFHKLRNQIEQSKIKRMLDEL